MQYGEPTLSAQAKSGSALRKSPSRPLFRLAMAIPAGLRSQTPISHTASQPYSAIAFHSGSGTQPKFRRTPSFWLRLKSQTHVLISYMAGYRGHCMLFLQSLFLCKCAYFAGRNVCSVSIRPNSTRSVASFGPWFMDGRYTMVSGEMYRLSTKTVFGSQFRASRFNQSQRSRIQDAFAGGCQGVSQGTPAGSAPDNDDVVTAWHGRASLQTWTALHEAAVGENRCCSDVAGSALGQHGNHTADLFRLSHSAQGYGGV